MKCSNICEYCTQIVNKYEIISKFFWLAQPLHLPFSALITMNRMLLQVLKRENPNVCKFRKENNTLQSKQSERQIDPKENEQDKE